MPLSRHPGSGQEQLFNFEETLSPERYAAVDVHNRARAFDEVFTLINQVRRSDGLQKHAESDDGRIALEVRYGQNTSDVLTGSAHRADRAEQRLKHLFAAAYGLTEMDAAGTDQIQSRAMAAQDYKDFTKRAGFGQADKSRRDKQQKQIMVSAGIIDGSRYPQSGRLKPRRGSRPA